MQLEDQTDVNADEVSSPGVSPNGGRIWRSIWRTHFYAGIFAGPVMVWLALTGLVILYTGPLNSLIHGDLERVAIRPTTVSLESQVNAAREAMPSGTLESVTPPARPGWATVVAMTAFDGTERQVYVDPYTGRVTGEAHTGNDIIGFANRTHGSIVPRGWTVPMPTIAGLLGQGPTMQHIEVGEILVEVAAGWGLVLAASGLYLWWPRNAKGRRRFLPSFSKPGRARLRALHVTGGLVLSGFLVFSVVSGLPWASFWGTNWQALANTVTPNSASFWSDPTPTSKLPTVGDLTRSGVRVPWAASMDTIPGSTPTGAGSHPGHNHGASAMVGTSSSAPVQPVSIDDIVAAGRDEGVMPGATYTPPADVTSGGTTQYGSWVAINPWPSSFGQQGAVYFNQFNAKTIGRSTARQWGLLQQGTELGVQTHMGTEFGVWTRILMTGGCLLVIWSFITGFLMWNRRRRGGTGFPRRPMDVSVAKPVGIAAIVLAVIYPLWGLSFLLVLGLDHFVIQRRPRLSRLFGMTGGTRS